MDVLSEFLKPWWRPATIAASAAALAAAYAGGSWCLCVRKGPVAGRFSPRSESARDDSLATTALTGLRDLYFVSRATGLLLAFRRIAPDQGQRVTGVVLYFHAAGATSALCVATGEAALFTARGLVVYALDNAGS